MSEATHTYKGRPCFIKESKSELKAIRPGETYWKPIYIIRYTDDLTPKEEKVSKKTFDNESFKKGVEMTKSQQMLNRLRSLGRKRMRRAEPEEPQEGESPTPDTA